MGHQYPDCMIDLETTGTQPETTNIIQIAAVRFNLETGEIDPKFFNRCLYPSPNRFWDEGTRDWWATMPDVLAGIYARMEPPARVMRDFVRWAEAGGALWAKPTSFEFPFLQSYCREFELTLPFHFRFTMDQNTFIRARHFPAKPPAYEKEIEFIGDQHDAMADVFHQIKVVHAAYEATK